MFSKGYSLARAMGCCGCFGFTKRPKQSQPIPGSNYRLSRDFLLDDDIDDDDYISYNGDATNPIDGDDDELHNRVKRSEEILRSREQNGMICRQVPVKETNKLVRTEVSKPAIA